MSVDRCIHDVIQDQARAAPDAIALVDGDKKSSYGELDARANQFAHLLRSSGVGADTRVGLCMQRSIDLATGALCMRARASMHRFGNCGLIWLPVPACTWSATQSEPCQKRCAIGLSSAKSQSPFCPLRLPKVCWTCHGHPTAIFEYC